MAIEITNSESIDRKLQESESKYRELVQNANSAIIRWKRDGAITFFNEYAQAFFGYSEDEVIGKHVNILLPERESTGSDLTSLVRDIVSHPERYVQNINENICRDGRRVWMAWTNRPVFEEDGSVKEILAVGTDFTERKKAEEALRESEARLAAVLENLPVGVWIADSTGRVTAKNKAADRIWAGDAPLSCRPEDYVEYGAWDVETGRGLEFDNYPLTRTLMTGLPITPVELRIRRFNGTEGFIMMSTAPLRSPDGLLTGAVAINVDVTERKQAEEALRQTERKYRELVQYAPTAIYEVDFRAKRFTAVNDAMCHMVGYSREELLAMNPFDLTDEDGKSRFHARITQWLKGKEPDKNVEYKIRAKDGHMLDVVLDVTFTADENGEPLGATVVGHDITERKQMEEVLRKSRDELELRVQGRTEELQTYMKELQRSNKALQEFASIASHDMQEPLRKVISFGKMLKQSHADSLGDKGTDYLDRMVNAAERMDALLKSLLDYSRITTRAEPFRKVDLAIIVSGVLSDLEVRIEKSGGEVRVSHLPAIEADPIQMHQLFQNLISNALKFQKEGQKPLIEVRDISLDNGMTDIHVADNGVGFDAEYLDQIFAPFQRLHGRGQYEGTGMGLAICKKIVDRHNGTITAKSAPGRGSVFTVTLPTKQGILNKPRQE